MDNHSCKDFIFPVEQLPHPMRKQLRNAGAMDGKEIAIILGEWEHTADQISRTKIVKK